MGVKKDMMKIRKYFFAGDRSADGKFLFLAAERTSCLFDADKKKIVNTFSYSADSVAFDEEDGRMYALETNGMLHVYDLSENKELFSRETMEGEKGFYFESGICAIEDKVYFIGANCLEERSACYCFRYDLQEDTLKKREIESGSRLLGIANGNIVYCYADELETPGNMLFKVLDEELHVKNIFSRDKVAFDLFLRNDTLYYIAYEENAAYFTEERGGRVIGKRKIGGIMAEILRCAPRSGLDTDGRYITIVYFDKFEEKDKLLCYDILNGKIVTDEATDFASSACVMKNGIFYGGESCCFKAFEEFS